MYNVQSQKALNQWGMIRDAAPFSGKSELEK